MSSSLLSYKCLSLCRKLWDTGTNQRSYKKDCIAISFSQELQIIFMYFLSGPRIPSPGCIAHPCRDASDFFTTVSLGQTKVLSFHWESLSVTLPWLGGRKLGVHCSSGFCCSRLSVDVLVGTERWEDCLGCRMQFPYHLSRLTCCHIILSKFVAHLQSGMVELLLTEAQMKCVECTWKPKNSYLLGDRGY